MDVADDSTNKGANICLTIAYDGTCYHGWQRQPNAITVEEILKGALGRILNHEVKLIAGARTDAGVHAIGQVVNFRTDKIFDHGSLTRGLNSLLPSDIRIQAAKSVDETFHARYSARSKTYVYCILNQPHNSPFLARYTLHVPYQIDISRMNEAAKTIEGKHDFSAFKKKDEAYRDPVRHVLRSGVFSRGGSVYIVIEATGFLRYMVRNIVGTILLVGRGKIGQEEFASILESREREMAGPTAPPQGLFLRRIKY